jgi:hypothetical protein
MVRLIPLFLLFASLPLFVSEPLRDVESVSAAPTATPSPTPEKRASIQIKLDKGVLHTRCPGAEYFCVDDITQVKVSTSLGPGFDSSVEYYYQVSGGRIIGSGPEVIWEIENTMARGIYTISVGVGKDRILSGETASASITMEECPECHPTCECPSIAINAPTARVTPGDTIVVNVYIGGDEFAKLPKLWTVTGGNILRGQGTQRIFVLVDRSDTASVDIVFEILETDPNCNCPATETVSIAIKK